MAPNRWEWTDAAGADRLAQEIADHGFSLFHMPEAVEESREPETLLKKLFGGHHRPIRIHPLTIKVDAAFAAKKTYPKTSVAARLHVDPPNRSPVTPHLQVMVCRRPSESGGENLVLDVWKVLARIEQEDPALFHDLFNVPRRIGLANEVVFGATMSLRRKNLLCLHGAVPPSDEVGRRFRRLLDDAELVEFRTETGDVYINNNHRTLHGRRSFSDERREFERLLVWVDRPFAVPEAFLGPAEEAAARLAARLAGEPSWVREAFGAALSDEELASTATLAGPPQPKRLAALEELLERLSGATA